MAVTATITEITTTLTKRQYCGLHYHCRGSNLDGGAWTDFIVQWEVTSAPSGWSMAVDDPRTGGLGTVAGGGGWDAATDPMVGSLAFALYADRAGDYTVRLTITNKSTGAAVTDTVTSTVADTSGYTTIYVNPSLATGSNDGTSPANAYQSWDTLYAAHLATQGDADKLILVTNGETITTTSTSDDWFVTAASGTSGNVVIMPDTEGGQFTWDTDQTVYAIFRQDCNNITIVGAQFVNASNSATQSGRFTNAIGITRTSTTMVDCVTDTDDKIDQCGGEYGGSGTTTGYLGLRNNFTNSSADERFAPDSGSNTVLSLGCTYDRNSATDSFRTVYSLQGATNVWFVLCDINNEYTNDDVGLRFKANIDSGAVGCLIGAGVRTDEESAGENGTHYLYANEVTSNTGANLINACVYAPGNNGTYTRDVYSESNVYTRKDNIGTDADDRGDVFRYEDAGTLYSVNDTLVYQSSATGGRFGLMRANAGTIDLTNTLMLSDTSATNWSAADDKSTNTINAVGCVWPLDHGGKETNAADFFDINGTGYASSAAIEAVPTAGWSDNTDAARTLDANYVADTRTAPTGSYIVVDYNTLQVLPVFSVGAVQETPAALNPSAAPAGVTGAYAYAGVAEIKLEYTEAVTYSGPLPYPFTVTNGSGGVELTTGVSVSGSTVTVTFSGDTPASGDSTWTVSLNNAAGKLTTTSNGAPVANFTDLAVAVTSAQTRVYRGRSRDRNVWWGIR